MHCQYCHRPFKYEKCLADHIRQVHADKLYKEYQKRWKQSAGDKTPVRVSVIKTNSEHSKSKEDMANND